jgi:hypothetical protein
VSGEQVLDVTTGDPVTACDLLDREGRVDAMSIKLVTDEQVAGIAVDLTRMHPQFGLRPVLQQMRDADDTRDTRQGKRSITQRIGTVHEQPNVGPTQLKVRSADAQ